MGNLSNHFNRSEMACFDGCGFNCADKILIETLETVREHFRLKYPDRNVYIKITSGNRCKEHNKKVGGSPESYHTKGMAADFIVNDVNPYEVQTYLAEKYQNWFGIGSYSGWTHLDTRSQPARWHG